MGYWKKIKKGLGGLLMSMSWVVTLFIILIADYKSTTPYIVLLLMAIGFMASGLFMAVRSRRKVRANG